MSSTAGDAAISLEETNKLREKLGLAPLATEDQIDENESSGEEQYDTREDTHKPADNLYARKKDLDLKEKLIHSKEQRQMKNKLSKLNDLGKDKSNDNLDDWISKINSNSEQGNYNKYSNKYPNSSSDLDKTHENLTVQHDAEQFDVNQDVILTLKDSNILENNEVNTKEDILVNVNMVDNESAIKNIKARSQATSSGYNPYEADLENKNILSKYDEIIEGPQKKQFKIADYKAEAPFSETLYDRVKSDIYSLEDIQQETSNYLTNIEIKRIKKSKKKKIRKHNTGEEDSYNVLNDQSMQKNEINDGQQQFTKFQKTTENIFKKIDDRSDEVFAKIEKLNESKNAHRDEDTDKVELDATKEFLNSISSNTKSSDSAKKNIVEWEISEQKKQAQDKSIFMVKNF
ncbi:MAG: U4/U6.U5 tri-snRNP-associated protein 1 [Paramarteilia canceri]